MQPSGPKMNPVEAALQQQSLGLQLKQIEAQNRLASAETAKTLSEANKIAGVDTKGKDLENKWQEIKIITRSTRPHTPHALLIIQIRTNISQTYDNAMLSK